MTQGSLRRRPDAGVECGPLDDDSHEAGDVRLVAEVLSPSTREFDMFGKLDEYKAIESLDYILLVEPNAPKGVLWSRSPDREWTHTTFRRHRRIDGNRNSRRDAAALGESMPGLTFGLRPS